MELARKIEEKYKVIKMIYMYKNLEERFEHMTKMKSNGWEVVKKDRRKELGYAVLYSRKELIQE